MNTSRLQLQPSLTRAGSLSLILTKSHLLLGSLSLAVLLSGLSIIYVSNAIRNCHANMQQMIAEHSHLHTQRNRLLLEKSTWVAPQNVQRIAEKRLGMLTPDQQPKNFQMVVLN